MAFPLAQDVVNHVAEAKQLYYRLVLLIGSPQTGKTQTLRILHNERGWPLVNVNLVLSERLLDLTAKQRTLRVARIFDDIVHEQVGDTVLLDNIEMLFHPDLKQDPLRLLQSFARNRTIVATWRGGQLGTSLTYAAPDHPEYRRFDEPQALIISSGGIPGSSGTTSTQEYSA